MDPKEKKTKQEEELKVDDIQDTVEGQSQNEEATGSNRTADRRGKVGKRARRSSGSNRRSKDKYLRLSAEFDNYRKRTVKEKAELILNGGEKKYQKHSAGNRRYGTCTDNYGNSHRRKCRERGC